jgi:amidophosphoribosyltransferase
MFGCKFLNFSRTSNEMSLMSRKVICELENSEAISVELLKEYADENSAKHRMMVEAICKKLNFTSLEFVKLSELIEAIGVEPQKLCTYCWNGEE